MNNMYIPGHSYSFVILEGVVVIIYTLMYISCVYNWTAGPVVPFDQIDNKQQGKKAPKCLYCQNQKILQNTTNKFQYFYYEYSTECDYTAWL